MIRLNRTTEYGLIALRHMVMKRHRADATITSAREVADRYSLPFEITAKTLQRLRDTGIIQSAQGARGGYTLSRPLNEVSLGEFLEMMEGPQSVVGCATALAAPVDCACEYVVKCEIKDVMKELNGKIKTFLSGICLGDLTAFNDPAALNFLALSGMPGLAAAPAASGTCSSAPVSISVLEAPHASTTLEASAKTRSSV